MLTVSALVVGIYIGYATERGSRTAGSNSSNSISDYKLNAIWELVDRHYVDPLDGDSVMDKVYAAILSTLDPHSIYLSQQMLKRENEMLRGNFEGVGIVIRMRNDTVCASQIIPGGPSEQAGVLAGDRILRVDGQDISGVGISSDSAVTLLRGRRKSVADLLVYRPSENKTHIIKVVRNIISTPSLTYSGMLDASTGYIRLGRFGETTYEEFCDAVKELKSKGMKRMLLDLRGNSGGLLSAAVGICDELLPGKEMIVYTEGTHDRRKETHSSPGGLFCKGDLTVIIDEYSASASEIVSGAVQDNDRGTIVGRRSFGKGLVQQQFPLPDKSAVQLTIARYYTPSGRCIQRPYDKGTDEYYNDFLNQVISEYGNGGDSLLSQITDSTPYYTSKGRVVYGGGGILPDRIIHYKTEPNIAYYNMLVSKAVIADYTFDYVSRNIVNLRKQYPDEKQFIRNFRTDDKMLQELVSYGESKGLKADKECLRLYDRELRARVKAEIGDMLFTTSTFYAIMTPFDPELKEALKK